MSQHKIGLSNWTAEDKKLYRERRNKGLRGQLGYINAHQTVKDEKGKEQLVPLGFRKGFLSSRLQGGGNGKAESDPSFTKTGASRGKQRLLARSNSRGE